MIESVWIPNFALISSASSFLITASADFKLTISPLFANKSVVVISDAVTLPKSASAAIILLTFNGSGISPPPPPPPPEPAFSA